MPWSLAECAYPVLAAANGFGVMLELKDIQLWRGSQCLIREGNLRIHPGQRVGLVGANGCGKSSLFALLRGELSLDQGEACVSPHWVVAHMAQETPALACSALEYVLQGEPEIHQLLQAVAQPDQSPEQLAQWHQQLDELGGYQASARAAELLHGLGFSQAQQQWSVQQFSGGWRMRLNLAQALMRQSDLLLLDEPTNHLDLSATLWLERWLLRYPGTLLVISHDRDFLDALVEVVVQVDQGTLQVYRGNYSEFERQQAERLQLLEQQYAKVQAQRAQLQSFIDRFRAKATKATQAQSRLKQLAKLDMAAPTRQQATLQFQFLPAPRLSHPALRLQQAQMGYGETPLLSGVNFVLGAEDRIALLGLNGAGKSTLLKALAGEIALQSGERQAVATAQVGYFAQHQLDALDNTATPLVCLQRQAQQTPEQALRDYLGGFGFSGERVQGRVADFSGGERARLALALLVWSRPNILLLDEPTNHLDLPAREALIWALQQFAGAVILVSHDRHLLQTCADQLYLVAEGQVQPYDQDLTAYQRQLSRVAEVSESSAENSDKSQRKQQRQRAAQVREQRRPLQQRLKTLESAMSKAQQQLAEVMVALSGSEIYEAANKADLQQALQQQGALQSQIEGYEAEWFELTEQLEVMGE